MMSLQSVMYLIEGVHGSSGLDRFTFTPKLLRRRVVHIFAKHDDKLELGHMRMIAVQFNDNKVFTAMYPQYGRKMCFQIYAYNRMSL